MLFIIMKVKFHNEESKLPDTLSNSNIERDIDLFLLDLINEDLNTENNENRNNLVSAGDNSNHVMEVRMDIKSHITLLRVFPNLHFSKN